ncbi:MAG TPA: hypothetical protein VMA09_18440 [Candidatus Binataceae bacterium]|nr:hypothetical protein [Candidatus Binataceae bacterium]
MNPRGEITLAPRSTDALRQQPLAPLIGMHVILMRLQIEIQKST